MSNNLKKYLKKKALKTDLAWVAVDMYNHVITVGALILLPIAVLVKAILLPSVSITNLLMSFGVIGCFFMVGLGIYVANDIPKLQRNYDIIKKKLLEE